MVIWLMLEIQSLISFLSFRECSFPTIIRQGNRSIVGVSPSVIHPGGFRSFMSETVCFHHRRVIHLNNNLPKPCKSVQTQIWDPGVPNIRYEHGGKELRLNCFNKSRVTLFSVRISDVGGQFLKTPKILIHGGALLFLKRLGDGGALLKVSTISSDGEEDDETKFRCTWVRGPKNFSKEHSGILPETSNLMISMKIQDPESSHTTLNPYFLLKVMPKAFWSFNYKLIANKKCLEGGHNKYTR